VTDVAQARPEAFTAGELTRAFVFATDWLGVYVEEVNALNVYPVPDGDTGTNMHLTMQSVRRELNHETPKRMADLAHALAYGSLLGARGNSGVILSQVLKGFAEAIRDRRQLDVDALRSALAGATESAYAAVMKPVEGTILSVCRAMSEHAAENEEADAPLALLRDTHEAGQAALERTPEQLPLLKQAGVVDAGGLGLLRIVEGLIAHFDGRDLPPPPKVERRAQQQFEEEEFGFCTEFLLSDVSVPTRTIQKLVEPYGDSLLVVGAEGFVKGHVHTDRPERLLAEVAHYGTMVRSKVDDMSEQHSEILADVDMTEAEAPRVAVVAVSDGYGVTRVFRSLGARVVGGGQTNNPSVQDIADTVRSVGAETVIVMPNNKNIVMAAERVVELVPERDVRVLPTRTLGEGLAAAVAFRQDAEPDELIDEMRGAAEAAVTLEVTTASRDATIDEVAVQEGEYIGLVDGKLKASGATPEEVLRDLVDEEGEEAEIGTLFHAASVEEEAAQELAEALMEAHEDLDVEVHPGAPDLYPYLMVLE
jgi:hypothetical protein